MTNGLLRIPIAPSVFQISLKSDEETPYPIFPLIPVNGSYFIGQLQSRYRPMSLQPISNPMLDTLLPDCHIYYTLYIIQFFMVNLLLSNIVFTESLMIS